VANESKRNYRIEKVDANNIRVSFDTLAIPGRELAGIGSKIAGLKLENFIKPKHLIIGKDNKLESYEMPKVVRPKITKFSKLDKKDLIESLRAIRRDIEIFSQNDLLITNLKLKNIKILNNRIHLCGITNITHNMDRDYNSLANNVLINNFFGADGIVEEFRGEDAMIIYKYIYTTFMTSDDKYIEDFYEKKLVNESISGYVKRIKKREK